MTTQIGECRAIERVGPSSSSQKLRVAFLSHTAMGGDLVVGSHQLAKAIAREGHHVIHISAPLSIVHLSLLLREPFARTRLRRWLAGGQNFAHVFDIVPFTWLPWQLARLSPKWMDSYSRHMLMGPVRPISTSQLNTIHALIVDEPRLIGLATTHTGRTLIYRATDLYAHMRSDSRIIDAEREICRRADVLVATSAPVAEHLRQISGRDVQIISNGVEFEHFASAPFSTESGDFHLPGYRENRAIYAGAFDRRFGREALRVAAEQLPHKHFILVGPGGRELARAMAKPNVCALGAVDYRILPTVLKQCCVGLLPLSADVSNCGRSPMKLYEYAAAGLAVAATSTEELRRRRLATLCLAELDTSFPGAVAEAFCRASDAAAVASARASAQQESWDHKARLLLSLGGQTSINAGQGWRA
ncbi:MAG: glycosyltransferase [Terriglobales bacterium]